MQYTNNAINEALSERVHEHLRNFISVFYMVVRIGPPLKDFEFGSHTMEPIFTCTIILVINNNY